MQRVTVSIDDALANEFDALARSKGYASRSEAVRDLLREAVRAPRLEDPGGACVANLSYVYNHRERGLAALLADAQHNHHDLVVATSHVHLDHDHCLETVMLKGSVEAVRTCADTILAERGVRHGVLNLIPVDLGHSHAAVDRHRHPHVAHLTPRPG